MFEEAAAVGQHLGGPSWATLRGLADVARDGGDHAEAHRHLVEAMAAAEARHSKAGEAAVLAGRGLLARDAGRAEMAVSYQRAAIRLWGELGAAAELADSLEQLGGLVAAGGDLGEAARLFGSAEAVRETHGCVRSPADDRAHRAELAAVRRGLGSSRFRDAWSAGAGLPAATVVAEAAREATSRRSATGWDSLTPAEREVAGMVAQAFTNREIAGRLFLSPRTVETHLTRAYAKLGVSSRRELAARIPERRAPG